jgi:hypothetical protein
MNETGKRRGLARSIASLAGVAVLTGVVTVPEVRQTAHDNDPAVIELRDQEAERQRSEDEAEERRWRRHDRVMAITHYLTLALILIAAALFFLLIFGSMVEREEAARHGKPVPPVPDLTLPYTVPVL